MYKRQVINSVGTETSFLDKNLDYHSAHTYQIRSRNAEGYSEWSNELQVTTLEDPWRNVPEQSIKWEYGDQWGKIAHANDKNFNTMFHSTGDATVSYTHLNSEKRTPPYAGVHAWGNFMCSRGTKVIL